MTREEAILVLDHARPQTAEIDRQFYDDEDLNNALDMGIEAIKQEPCEDCISREDALARLRADTSFICTGDKLQAIEIVNNMSPVTPQPKTGHWIPVSERLPDTDEEVLVDDGIDRFVAWWMNDGFEEGWHSVDDIIRPILAWIPLPEPYEP